LEESPIYAEIYNSQLIGETVDKAVVDA